MVDREGAAGGWRALCGCLGVFAGREQGAVILPGIDRTSMPELREAIADDPAHPQHLMLRLLRSLEMSPGDVRDWPASPRPPAASVHERRVRLFGEALRPAAVTDGWRSLAAESPGTLAGV